MYDSLSYRLKALVKVDLSRHEATVIVRGWFTSTNYRGLLPVIRRAHALPGHPIVVVDHGSAAVVDPAAADLLEAACRSLFHDHVRVPVTLVASPPGRHAATVVASPVAA